MKMFQSIKGQRSFSLNDLSGVAISLVTVAIIIGLGATILSNIQADQVVNSTSYNTSGYGLTGLNTLASYVPTVALVAVAAIVIGIILVFFSRRNY